LLYAEPMSMPMNHIILKIKNQKSKWQIKM
jgi:hypothetical protein